MDAPEAAAPPHPALSVRSAVCAILPRRHRTPPAPSEEPLKSNRVLPPIRPTRTELLHSLETGNISWILSNHETRKSRENFSSAMRISGGKLRCEPKFCGRVPLRCKPAFRVRALCASIRILDGAALSALRLALGMIEALALEVP